MKKKCVIVLVCLVTIILLSCATTPSGNASSDQKAIEKVMANFITALTTQDINLLMSTYWNDAEMELNFGGNRTLLSGELEIRNLQNGGFESADGPQVLSVSVIERLYGDEIAEYTAEAEGSDFLMINHLRFQKRDGEWKIIHQFIEPAPAE